MLVFNLNERTKRKDSTICHIGILLLLFVFSFPRTLNTQTTVRFTVIGDYGWQGQADLDVSNLVKSWNPEFIITTGDNNYDYGEATTIDRNIGQYYHDFIYPYTGSYGAGATENSFFPTLGNHDWVAAGATPYLNYFTLPGNERYYDFVKGPVHFFALDSDLHEQDGNSSTSVQATWLKNKLSASTSRWKVVYFHHAPYSSGTMHASNTTLQWPFKAWGASAVLSGHEHNYERLTENDLVYFVNGSGGRSLYSFGTAISGSQIRYSSDYGAQLVTANDDTLTFKFITRTGSIIDTYSLVASHHNYSLSVQKGWNLLSLPVKVLDPRTTTLFSTATSPAFAYNGYGYSETDSIQNGTGFWLKFNTAQSVDMNGDSLLQDTIDVVAGWNMIGAIVKSISVSSIIQSPADNVASGYFGYTSSYLVVDTLKPRIGYWVKIKQDGKLILTSPTP